MKTSMAARAFSTRSAMMLWASASFVAALPASPELVTSTSSPPALVPSAVACLTSSAAIASSLLFRFSSYTCPQNSLPLDPLNKGRLLRTTPLCRRSGLRRTIRRSGRPAAPAENPECSVLSLSLHRLLCPVPVIRLSVLVQKARGQVQGVPPEGRSQLGAVYPDIKHRRLIRMNRFLESFPHIFGIIDQ